MSHHPGLSIMIPTWRPDPGFLGIAVESVLAQVNPVHGWQVELVDDGSPDFDVEAFARRFGTDRVTWHRNERRGGLAGNWNTCIARARQPWVHLLHQDDFVLPGFYEAILQGITGAPEAAAVFTASHYVNSGGTGWAPRLVPMDRPGVLEDWLEHVFVSLSIQCSAIVVRREVYGELGGFESGLPYTLDWEMWKRIAVRHPIWFDPRPLACFRKHPGSETDRLRTAGEHILEIFRSIDRSRNLLPRDVADRAVRRARRHYAMFTAEEAMAIARSRQGFGRALALLGIARRQTSFATAATALGKVMARACIRPVLVRRKSVRMPPDGYDLEQKSGGIHGLGQDQ